MYVKVSEIVERRAFEAIAANLSKMDIVEKLKTVTPEDIAEVARILKSPSEKIMKSAGRAGGVAALLLVLTSMFGSALADAGVKKDLAGDLLHLKSKGQVTFQNLDDFQKDLPAPSSSFDGDLDGINKLIEDSKGLTVQEREKFKGFQQIVPVGKTRMMADNPKEHKALLAINKLINKMKSTGLTGAELDKRVDALTRAFNTKNDVKLA